MENSVQKRLRFQNEVMKWLNELSGNLQKRASDVTHEIDELLGQTDTVEQDMKNTLNSFRNLTCTGFVDNKISEEDDNADHSKERTRRTADTIRAQSYEDDILPRYREALSVGLSSYRDHMQKTNRTSSSGSAFKNGLASDSLPHIIGSAEYIHDNSCGLTDDFSLESSYLDFSQLLEPKRASFSTIKFGPESSDAIFSDVFGAQQGQTEKACYMDRSDPLVSAASDFKAMLEAALLSPYKFYDEGSLSLPDPVHTFDTDTEQGHPRLENLLSTSSDAVEDSNSQNPAGTMDSTLPVTSINLYSETQRICSELISESLFSTEEESMPVTSHDTLDDQSTENMHVDYEIPADSNKEDIIRNSIAEDEYNDAIEDDNVPRAAIIQKISTASLSSLDDAVNVE